MRSIQLTRLLLVLAFLIVSSSQNVSAKPHLVFDYKTGDIYSRHMPFDRWYPASLVKLMTTYTVFKEVERGMITLMSPVRISANARSQPPSKMGFPVSTSMTFDNAIKIIMVKSSNDVATAIAESASGTEALFVEKMNAYAKALGMQDSNFTNPHGLHNDNQYTSARDMGLLAQAILTEFPEHVGYFDISAFKFGRRTFRNHNRLLHRYSGTNGMKTGFTCPSGLNVVVYNKHFEKNLIAVVMGHKTGKKRNIYAAEILSQAKASKPSKYLGKFHAFKPNFEVAPPVNLRPQVCDKKYKPKAKIAAPNLLVSFDAETDIEREERLYLEEADMTKIITVSLGNTDGPDPFALLQEPFDPVDIYTPQLSFIDGSAPNQPESYNYQIALINDMLLETNEKFTNPNIKKLPVPTPNPDRELLLARLKYADILPQLSIVDGSAPKQPEKYLDQLIKTEFFELENRKIFLLSDGSKVTIPNFKNQYISKTN